METFAQVVVKIHTLKDMRSFTYRIPQGMRIEVGCRVSVPFGKRTIPGICIMLTNELPVAGLQTVKDILAVVDEHPILTEELIRLSFWGAERFLCSPVAFLDAILPSGFGTAGVYREKKVSAVSLTAAGMSACATGKKQTLLLQLLRSNSPATLADLERAGVSPATVYSVQKKGWVEINLQAVRRDPLSGSSVSRDAALALTGPQRDALTAIAAGKKHVLLHGVTGSGKTEVYLQAIAEKTAENFACIVLVPEIALTPQMTERFTARFGSLVAVLHSRLSAGERFDEWQRVASGEALVVIGARSAVFAPVKRLGLIILDEEHESSYKQEEAPRYHARDVALWRAGQHDATVVLGSATPSLESYALAEQGYYQLCRLPARIAGRPLPPVEIVDMRQELRDGNKSIFSRSLAAALTETFTAGKQAIIFLNRRGYATFVLCRECGHVMRCPACNTSLKYHSTGARLNCHYCEHHEPYPSTCPSCGGRYIRHFGTGTQRVAEELQKVYPDIKTLRIDADTTTHKGDHQKILTAFKKGQADVLVGTQMIAKGLDYPQVTLVGVITADTALNLPDFRAGERTFQLLTQVAGRAGRGEFQGRVVVQSYSPDHYAILAAQQHDFESFYKEETLLRRELGYPPFGFLIRLLISSEDEKLLLQACSYLSASIDPITEFLGPSPCPIEKIRGRFRWQLVMRGGALAPLLQAAKSAAADFNASPYAGSVRLSLDVEPQSLL